MKHVVLLLDVMGTKEAIRNDDAVFFEKLQRFERNLVSIVSKLYLQSKSMQLLIFSDSYIFLWNDIKEMTRYILPLSQNLYSSTKIEGLTCRIFAHVDRTFQYENDRLKLWNNEGNRIKKFLPVSIASWAVFLGETSRYAPGIYFENNLCNLLSAPNKSLFTEFASQCDFFKFRKLLLSNKRIEADGKGRGGADAARL